MNMFNKNLFWIFLLGLLVFAGCSSNQAVSKFPTKLNMNCTNCGGSGNIVIINGDVTANASGDMYLYNPTNLTIRFNNTKIDARINSLTSHFIDGVIAGTGLTGGGTSGNVTINANTSYLQRRVSYSCSTGSSIRVINSDGTVTCETDSTGGSGTVTDIYTSAGLTGGHITTSGTIGVNYSIITNKTFTAATYVPYSSANTDLDLNGKSFKNFFISKTIDPTARFNFDVSGLSGTRTLTVRNTSGTIALTSDFGIISGKGLQISSTNFGIMNCGNNEILKYNTTSSAWACKSDNAGTGTVTSIATTRGVLGGTITSTGTLSLNHSLIANHTWVQEQLATVIYYPTNITVLKGTPLNVNKGNLSYVDNQYGNITEASGTLPIQLYINYTGVDMFNNVFMKERYMGGSGHIINLDLYNYNTSTWDTQFTFSDQSNYVTNNIAILDNAQHVQAGKVQLRLVHQSNGNPSHKLSIDTLVISKGVSSISANAGTVTSVTAGSGLTGGSITASGTIAADFSIIANKTYVTGLGYLTAEVDGDITNEIQNIIASKGLQRDGSNNFGLINCGLNQVLKYNSSNGWGCANDTTGGTGTVKSINAGTGLTGGNITTAGTIALNTTYITNVLDAHDINYITTVYNPNFAGQQQKVWQSVTGMGNTEKGYWRAYSDFNGAIGEAGATTGTVTYTVSDVNIWGALNCATGGTKGNDCAFSSTGSTTTNNGYVNATQILNYELTMKSVDTTSKRQVLGVFRTTSSASMTKASVLAGSGATGYGFYASTNTSDFATSNWRIFSCNAGVCTILNTSIALDTSYHRYKIVPNLKSSNPWVAFYYDNVLQENITTTSTHPRALVSVIGAWLETDVASARNNRFDTYLVEATR